MVNVPKMEKSEKQSTVMPGSNAYTFPVFPNPVITQRFGQSVQENVVECNSGVNSQIFNNLAKNMKQGFGNEVIKKVGFYLLFDVLMVYICENAV